MGYNKGGNELGKNNCVTKGQYTTWVHEKVEEFKLPYLCDPFMCMEPPNPTHIPKEEVSELKATIFICKKEYEELQ